MAFLIFMKIYIRDKFSSANSPIHAQEILFMIHEITLEAAVAINSFFSLIGEQVRYAPLLENHINFLLGAFQLEVKKWRIRKLSTSMAWRRCKCRLETINCKLTSLRPSLLVRARAKSIYLTVALKSFYFTYVSQFFVGEYQF